MKEKTNHPDVVPCLHLEDNNCRSVSTVTSRVAQQRVARFERNVNRHAGHPAQVQQNELYQEPETGVGCQTDTVYRHFAEKSTQTDGVCIVDDPTVLINIVRINEMIETNGNLRGQLSSLQKRVEELDTELKKYRKILEVSILEAEKLKAQSLKWEHIKDNEQKVKFYTGQSPPMVAALIEYLKSAHPNPRDDHDNCIILVLTKLRLNLLNEDLSYRFNISKSTTSRYFHEWLDIMDAQLSYLVMWPTSNIMQLPPVFQNPYLRKVKVVVDCFEIFIERPTSLKARAQTYSQYKSHNTVKVLLGVSPSCAVTFVSEGWGGRASDKLITMNSGLLDKLNPGDVVLADRGFLIQEDFACKNVKVIMPAFTKGKSQLERKSIETSRLYSRARIHVERVINRCRDYRILKGPIPISLLKRPAGVLPTVNKIVRVSCALTNLNEPVLKS